MDRTSSEVGGESVDNSESNLQNNSDHARDDELRQLITCRHPSNGKRAFDLSVSIVLLIVLFPFLLLIALLIKLSSRGPVFYVQPRVGYGGQYFRMYKFRTMHHRENSRDEEHRKYVAGLAEGNQTVEKPNNRSELTWYGNMLRATSMDELPQLWNVIKGDMSLVGPRPDLLRLSDYSPEQLKRFEVLPGITGLWQVNEKNDMTFNEMIDLDLEYVERNSLWLDMRIVLTTAFGLLKISNS